MWWMPHPHSKTENNRRCRRFPAPPVVFIRLQARQGCSASGGSAPAARHGGAADRAHCVCAAPLPAALCGADRVRRRNGDRLAAAALVLDRSAACRVFGSRLCLHDAPVPSPAHSAAAVRRRAAFSARRYCCRTICRPVSRSFSLFWHMSWHISAAGTACASCC